MDFIFPTQRDIPFAAKQKSFKRLFIKEIARRATEESTSRVKRNDEIETREVERQVWKRDLSLRTNGTVDPWVIIQLISLTCITLNLQFLLTVRLLPPGHVR